MSNVNDPAAQRRSVVLAVAHHRFAEVYFVRVDAVAPTAIKPAEPQTWLKYLRREESPYLTRWRVPKRVPRLPQDQEREGLEARVLGWNERPRSVPRPDRHPVLAHLSDEDAAALEDWASYKWLPGETRAGRAWRKVTKWTEAFDKVRTVLLALVAITLFILVGGPMQLEQLEQATSNNEVKAEASLDTRALEVCPSPSGYRRFTLAPTFQITNQGWRHLQLTRTKFEVIVSKDAADAGAYAQIRKSSLWDEQFGNSSRDAGSKWPEAVFTKDDAGTSLGIIDKEPVLTDQAAYAHGEKFGDIRSWVLDIPEAFFQDQGALVTVSGVAVAEWCACERSLWSSEESCDVCSGTSATNAAHKNWRSRSVYVLNMTKESICSKTSPAQVQLTGTLTMMADAGPPPPDGGAVDAGRP